MTMCKHCGKEIREDDIFCPYCGANQQTQQFPKTCPNCHREVRENENFCSYCGTRIVSQQYTYTRPIYDYNDEVKEEEPVKHPWLNIKMWIIFGVLVVVTIAATFFYGDGSSLPILQDPSGGIVDNPGNVPGYDYDDTFDGSLIVEQGNSAYYGNLNNGGFVFADEEALYAINNDQELIKRYHKLGLNEVVITKDVSGYVQVYNGMLYYTDESHHYLYSVDKNNQIKLIIEEPVYYVIFHDDKIYYQRDSDNESIYCANLDGSQQTKLNDTHSYNIMVYNDQIYYTTSNDGIYRMNLDGSGQIQISNERAYGLAVAEDKVYFINQEDALLYSMSLNGQDRTVVYNKPIAEFVIDDSVIYFSDTSATIGRISLQGEGAQLFNNTGVRLQVVGDYLFYQEYNYYFGSYGDWECSYKDGSQRQAPYTSTNYQYV